MRRIAFVALAALSACGTEVQGEAAPLDTFYKPSGVAVQDGKLLVASSNFDLRYESNLGGTVIGVDPGSDPARLVGGVGFASFTGDLVVADAAACGLDTSLALVPTRSVMSLYPIRMSPDGALACDRCAVPLGSGSFADPLAMGVACGVGRPRAFVAYLRSANAHGWITEYDLATGATRNGDMGLGPVRGFAFDASSGRLWMTGLATAVQTPLRWVDLRGGCAIDGVGATACHVGAVAVGQLPAGLELHGIALANPSAPGQGPGVRRVYLTGRFYDLTAAGNAGGRTLDFGGVLLAGDLVDNASGGVDLRNVAAVLSMGSGAGDVRVLPPRSGKRDVVAALASDDGELWIYDDDSRALAFFGRDPTTGAPVLGHEPYGIGVDGRVRTGNVARIYVGSFEDSYVTPIDVPLDAPDTACMVASAGGCVTTAAARRIQGGTP